MRGPRLAAVLLVGGAAAAPMRAGDSDAGPAGASALQAAFASKLEALQSRKCDPTWCDCQQESCDAQSESDEPAPCNLCGQKWVFVLSAAGRSGSTSLLEGLNALPGVSLSGENLGLLSQMQQQFNRVDHLVSMNEPGNAAAFSLPEWRGRRMHTLCAQQSIMASLAGGNGSLVAAKMGGHDQIFGFKELIELPSFEADGPFPGEFPHLEVSARKRAWVSFLEQLFPCSRLVLNLRRDTAAQARAILSSFGDFARDPLGDATPPLTLVERDVEEASRFILELHKNKSASGRSFLVHTEDMTAELFSQLAQWLGRPCTFDSPPTANELDPTDPDAKMSHYGHSAPVNVSCDAGLPPALSPEQLWKYTGPAADAAPADNHTWAYEKLVNDTGSEDDECGEVDVLPHNEACAPQLSQHANNARRWHIGSRRSALLNVGDLPSFYLHEGDPYSFHDSVACMLNATGLRRDVDAFDEQLIPDAAEHMVDWWLLKRFERHPSRVFDPDAAQLHVIGSPFTTAFRAHNGFNLKAMEDQLPQSDPDGALGCGNMDAFYRRTAAIAKHLTRTSWWKQHGGRNFLMLNSFYHLKDVLGQELLSTLLSGPVIFTSSDRNYVDYLAIKEMVTPTIVPYKAHYRLEDFAWLQADNAHPRARTGSVMFHGSSGRGFSRFRPDHVYEEGQLRQEICDRLGPEFAGNSLRCVQEHWQQLKVDEAAGEDLQAGGTDAPRKADPLTLEAYLNSKLCLAPAGDTPTSRRLFDSMAAGCLPVLMAPPEDIMPNLPFPKAIDWPQTVLFGGGLSCSLSDNADATIRWLQSLLKPENEKKLQCMARRAQKVFLKYLTLRDEGVVSALLHEIDLKRVLSADAAPDAGWLLEAAAPGTRLQCSAGRRGATEEECLAAVREAASREGLDVEVELKSVNVGAAGFVPIGCSYSSHTKTAMFNTNPDGGDRAGSYRLACRGRGAE